MRGTHQQRFEIKFNVGELDSCWLWEGAKHRQGYGLFRLVSSEPMKLAHRISYTLYVGELDDSLKVLHTCDNPACVNPSHLVAGTQADNMKDCAEKGRMWLQNLTAEQVLEVRNAPGTQRSIADKYGISQQQVSRIKLCINHERK